MSWGILLGPVELRGLSVPDLRWVQPPRVASEEQRRRARSEPWLARLLGVVDLEVVE